MVGLRRGPGGPAEWRVGKLRQAALRGAQEVLEDELAVGLQPISRHCAFLLGRGARPWGDSGDFKSQWSEWWSAEIEDAVGGQIRTLPLVMCQEPVPVPSALETASGFQVVPAAEELVRLEGHQWATHWAEGRGSVFRLDRFGRRGEGVLVPEFCCLEEPKSRLRIQLGTETREVSWIAEGLHKLATSVNRCRKIPVTELIQHIQSCQSLTLMVPVTRLAFKTRASIKEFSRRAARRFPFYIDSIEMGARLQISVVPPLNTASGEPDCLDVEELERTVGAQLFPLSDLKGLLCIRRFGGPPLQIAALGNQLKDICDYLAVTWVDSLFAAPTTWARLFVCVEPCGALEATLGHVPGRGLFTKEIYAPHCACGEAAIGSEVLEETMDTIPVCRDCGAFVPGSEGFFSKKGLAQHTSRPAEELLGSFDTQLDDTLTMADDMISWAEATVPEDCAVLAAGGMLSLKPPKRGWPEDVKAELHQQLQMVIGCPGDALHITMTSTEADSPNLMVTFVMIHPAVLKAGRASELGTADPKMPLLWYQNLEKQLKRMAENQSVRSQWTKSVEDRAVPLLFISDLQRVVLPCSLFLLKHEQLWPTLQAHREGSGRASSIPGEVGLCIDLIRERIGPKDGIERGRRQSLDVQRRRSVQERRATVAEICGAEGMKLQEADLSLLRKLSEDASRRHSLAQDATDKAQRAAAFAASEAAAEAAAEAEAASSSSASSASASPLASEVRDSQGLNAEPEPTEPTEPTEPGPVAPVEATNQAGSPEPSPASPAITVSPNVPEAPQAVSQLPEDPVVTAVLRFKPSLEHLALRLRDLVSQAAWENQAQRVENLLTRWGGPDQALAIAGRSSRSSDFGGQSSLDLSVKACNYHVTHVLLKHLPTASHELVSILNGHNPVTGHSLLYAAVRYSNRHTAFVVQELIRRRADVNGPGSSPSTTSERALVHCVRRADIALIQTLLDHRAFVNLVADDGKTLLQTAVGRGDASILGCLLRNEGCNVNMLDRFQRSALVSALRQDRRPFVLVQMLLDASCSSCSVDVDGMQPLAHAVGLQDPHIYRSLLLGRADPNAVAVPVNDKQTYMLHFAAKARDEVMIACLLQAEADPNLKAKNDRTVLHLAVGLQLSEETVSLILEKRADPNASAGLRAGGETPLRMAVLADNPSVKLLLCARADPNICNQAGCSAFFAASLPGMGAAAQTLLFGDTRVPSTTPPWHSQRASCQSGGMDVTHPMHMASTWRKARWRPRVGRPTLIHTQEVTDFDPLFPFNLPPISKKFRETR